RLRREAAKVTADLTVGDGDALPAGSLTLRVVHTPGHSPGHICLFLEEERVLFSGDNVLGIGTTAIAPPPSGDMAQYLDSLRKMKALDAALICPGHGPIVRQANRKIQELIDHRRERDEQVLLLISQGKDRLSALVREIYPELSPHLERMARGQILSHLYKLQREGKVVMREEGDEVACRLQG
ncbi:MAG: MBL fold metallo-hydrolase, partial [Dehalococcoidia bacterium]|nr:MBL fold metallo-hydrolase [Dehalococcoidia bacterium]